MDKQNNIKQLLHKFIHNRCSPEETEHVIAYYRENTLTDDFPTVEEIQDLLDAMPETDAATADSIFAAIMQKAAETEKRHTEEKPVRRMPWLRYASVAASVAILLTAGWVYFKNTGQPVKVLPRSDSNEITLTMENGDVKVISENGETTIKGSDGNIVASQDKTTLSYGTTGNMEKLVYNTLTIPYGKRFRLELSDGTIIHLNSGTSLRYPVKFIKGQNRMVYLNGEAFFDVAKDKAHPFIVNADNLNVRVLGTHFNVSNYPEDSHTDVVLVEGSVGMYSTGQHFDPDKNVVLKPGFKGSFNKANFAINTKEVTTGIYTAWIRGELVFRDMTFKNICKKLERHYNISIENNDAALANEKFNASFKDESIENIMSYFNEIHAMKYTINNNKVTIN